MSLLSSENELRLLKEHPMGGGGCWRTWYTTYINKKILIALASYTKTMTTHNKPSHVNLIQTLNIIKIQPQWSYSLLLKRGKTGLSSVNLAAYSTLSLSNARTWCLLASYVQDMTNFDSVCVSSQDIDKAWLEQDRVAIAGRFLSRHRLTHVAGWTNTTHAYLQWDCNSLLSSSILIARPYIYALPLTVSAISTSRNQQLKPTCCNHTNLWKVVAGGGISFQFLIFSETVTSQYWLLRVGYCNCGRCMSGLSAGLLVCSQNFFLQVGLHRFLTLGAIGAVLLSVTGDCALWDTKLLYIFFD